MNFLLSSSLQYLVPVGHSFSTFGRCGQFDVPATHLSDADLIADVNFYAEQQRS